MKILFCVNKGAGTGRIDAEDLIRQYFDALPHEAIILVLDEDRAKVIEDALREHKPDRVVAVGGDGTVNLIASLLGTTGIPMGIIPAGSANGLATDLAIPADPTAALDLVVSGNPRPIDAILINGCDICLHLSDLGLNARLIRYFDQTEARGMFTYVRLSFRVLRNKKRIRATITTPGGEIRRAAFMVVLANARKYGTGATINKEGAIDDGVFEVVLVRRFDIRELWASLRARKRFDPKRVEVVKAREVVISLKHATDFQVDGDHKGRIDLVHAKILPGHIQLIYPEAVSDL